VRIIVPFPPGGNTDITARTIGSKLADVFGQQVIIDNRPGGGAAIGAALAARAMPDGYTLFMAAGAHTINVSLVANLQYDTVRDFAPIILCIKGASVLTVHPSVPVKNLKELIALARAKPGQLSYASSGLGSTNHMAGELLKMMVDINILHVPYKGNTPALTDTIAGHVEMMFSGVPVLRPHIESGRLRAIAIGSLTRFPALPSVPTFHESGLKGYEVVTFAGLMAPIKTPAEIVSQLNVEVNKM
jgi:tripartite-type tricarboxylate transporter receptor subunit TctC